LFLFGAIHLHFDKITAKGLPMFIGLTEWHLALRALCASAVKKKVFRFIRVLIYP
jgi:hypothetical protein